MKKLELLTNYEKRISSLFSDLIDKENKITPYNLELISEEIKHINNLIKDLNKNGNNDDNKLSSEEKKELLRYALIILLGICISCFAPGLFPIILVFIFRNNMNKKELKEDNNNIEEIERFLKKIKIELENCQRFINHRKKFITSDEKNSQKFTEFDFANSIINYFLENPTISTRELNNYDENIKSFIIKILQEDLNTDINNIESLIICARSQILKQNKEYKIEEYSRIRKNAN